MSCFEILDDMSGEALHASTPLERPLRVFDRDDVSGIVVGDGVRIAARKILEIECSRVRFNPGVERNVEPPQFAPDGACGMRSGVVSRYGDSGGLQD